MMMMMRYVFVVVQLFFLHHTESSMSSCDEFSDLCTTVYANGERVSIPSRILLNGSVPSCDNSNCTVQTCCETEQVVMSTCENFDGSTCSSEFGPTYCKVTNAVRTPCPSGGECSAKDCCFDCVSSSSEYMNVYQASLENKRCTKLSVALGHFDNPEMCRETAKIESRCFGTFAFSSLGECRCCSNDTTAVEQDSEWDIYTYDRIDFSECIDTLNATSISSSSLKNCLEIRDVSSSLDEIWNLDLSNLNLTSLPVLMQINDTVIKTLDLSSNHFETLPTAFLNTALNVEHLDLSDCKISSIGSTNSFQNLPSLKILVLSRQQVTTNVQNDAFGSNLDSLEMIDLSANSLSTLQGGTFESVSGTLRILWLGENEFQDFQSERLGLNHSLSLTDLNLTSNKLEILNSSNFAYMHALRTIDLSNNQIVSLSSDTFRDTQNLTQLWLNGNNLVTLPSGIFSNCSSLDELYLYNNNIDIVTSRMFSIPSLSVLNLFYNSIREIQSDAFAGLSMHTLDLSHQSIERVHENAFRDINISELRLAGNNVRYISASSFVEQNILSVTQATTTCEHIEDWSVELVQGYFFNCEEFETLDSHIQGYHLGTKGSAGLSASDACCGLGGGVKTGAALQMDERSTVSCFSNNNNLTSIQCMCGDSDRRFDLITGTCVANCDVGKFWQATSTLDKISSGFLSDNTAGSCVECNVGLVGNSSVTAWPESCVICEGGTFTSKSGSTECQVCESNTYSDLGSSECISCPSGKMSNTRSERCETCSWEYTGSERCETMVLGIILIVVSVLVLLSTIAILWSKLRNQFKRLIAYRAEMNVTKELLETAHDDINLMVSAWHFDFSEITLDRKLAAGGAGQVWLGSLHDKWKVAIKEVFFSDEISLVDESEIKFLQRVRHRRLVLFLGCGRTNEGYIFTVLELMNGGSFDRLLWDGIPEHCDWKKRLQILADSAEGMSFLHAVIGSVHRDLKSPNILLDQEKGITRAKIADFGLARLVDQKALAKAARLARRATSSSMQVGQHRSSSFDSTTISSESFESNTIDEEQKTDVLDPENVVEMKEEGSDEVRYASMTGNRGTSAWMAPEMWSVQEDADEDAEHEYSQSVDVYAFAIIMWEALCFAAPWGSLKIKKIRKKVMDGDRPRVHKKYATEAPKGYIKLMKMCWAQNDRKRPTFLRIFNELQAMRIVLEKEEEEAKKQLLFLSSLPKEEDAIDSKSSAMETNDSITTMKQKTKPQKRLSSKNTPSGLRFWHARNQRNSPKNSTTTKNKD